MPFDDHEQPRGGGGGPNKHRLGVAVGEATGEAITGQIEGMTIEASGGVEVCRDCVINAITAEVIRFWAAGKIKMGEGHDLHEQIARLAAIAIQEAIEGQDGGR